MGGMGDESIKETPWHRYAINTGAEWIVYDSPISWPLGAGYIKARGLSESEMEDFLDCYPEDDFTWFVGEVYEGWE